MRASMLLTGGWILFLGCCKEIIYGGVFFGVRMGSRRSRFGQASCYEVSV